MSISRIYIIFFLLLPALGFSQTTYEQILQDGITAFEQSDYDLAINKFKAARILAPEKGPKAIEEVDTWMNQAEEKRLNALKEALATSDSLRKIAEEQTQRAIRERIKADSALEIANRILDRIGFFSDTLGPAYDARSRKYGYINRSGNEVIPFTFDEASPFHGNKFAKVSLDGKKYLIDRKGQRFRFASTPEELSDEIEAFELQSYYQRNEQEFKQFSQKIREYQNIKILLGKYLYIPKLTPEIFELKNLEYVNFSNCRFTTLPAEIGKLTKLKELDLSGNYFTSLPAEIGNCTQLEHVNLNDSPLESLPDEAGNWTQLKTLKLKAQKMKNLPESIGAWTNLEELDLGENNIYELPRSIGNWTHLKKLGVAVGTRVRTALDSSQTGLPKEVGAWVELEELDLKYYGIRKLPEEIGNWIHLEKVRLYLDEWKHLPPETGNWTKLKTIGLDIYYMESLPPEVKHWTKVEEVRLSSEYLKQLPDEIGAWTRLRDFSTTSNWLASLPPVVGNWKNLERCVLHRLLDSLSLPAEVGAWKNLREFYLPLDGKSLPNTIGNWRNLESLYLIGVSNLPSSVRQWSTLRDATITLYDNQDDIPEEVFTWTQLEDLSIQNASKIPPHIGNLKMLKSLDIRYLSGGNNRISELPPEIGNLTTLQSLELPENNIAVLPPEIGKLNQLYHLDLSKNQLKDLPPEIGKLHNLSNLNLQYNPIQQLPKEIASMKALRYLDCSGTLIKYVPPQISQLPHLYELNIDGTLLSPEDVKSLDEKVRVVEGWTIPQIVESLKSKYLKEGPQYFQLAYYQMLLGQFDDAFSNLNEGIDAETGVNSSNVKDLKTLLIPNLLFHGKLDEAKKIYQELLALPEDPLIESLNYTLEVKIIDYLDLYEHIYQVVPEKYKGIVAEMRKILKEE